MGTLPLTSPDAMMRVLFHQGSYFWVLVDKEADTLIPPGGKILKARIAFHTLFWPRGKPGYPFIRYISSGGNDMIGVGRSSHQN